MKIIAFVLALVICSVAFADAGPGPIAPGIEVSFMKDNVAYSGPLFAQFHCAGEGNATDSPVGERDINLSCVNGKCKNENWFYKFNPCFYPNDGYFLYKTAENEQYKQSDATAFNESRNYQVLVNMDSGKIIGKSSTSCIGIAVLLFVGCLAAFARRI